MFNVIGLIRVFSFSILTLLVTILFSSCSVIGSSAQISALRPSSPDWPKVMQKMLQDSPYTDAWGLFSKSGMEDHGQVMIIGSPSLNKADVYIVDRNSHKIDKTAILTKDGWKKFKSSVDAGNKLGTFEFTSFGGIYYQYIHIQKDEEAKIKPKPVKMLKMSNPDYFEEAEEAKAYINLRRAFHEDLDLGNNK